VLNASSLASGMIAKKLRTNTTVSEAPKIPAANANGIKIRRKFNGEQVIMERSDELVVGAE
jgi:hypothetical protein